MFSYWAKPHDGADIARYLNDHIAETVSEFPLRFIGLGTVPLQDTTLAIEEAERCKKTGLAGVQIGTNVNQLNLGEPQFFDFFAACEEFARRREAVGGVPTVIAGFEFEGFPFEIFGQPRPVEEQSAYRHMVVEARLLDIGGGPAGQPRIESIRAEDRGGLRALFWAGRGSVRNPAGFVRGGRRGPAAGNPGVGAMREAPLRTRAANEHGLTCAPLPRPSTWPSLRRSPASPLGTARRTASPCPWLVPPPIV